MKIMVVGGGGREHAIIKKLAKSPKVDKIYARPGNGGIAADAECVNIGAKDIDAIRDFAVENKIDFAVVAPDDPLVLGAVDALEEKVRGCGLDGYGCGPVQYPGQNCGVYLHWCGVGLAGLRYL